MLCSAFVYNLIIDLLEFDNFGAVMSVSEDLLCAFELLKVGRDSVVTSPPANSFLQPLDGQALKKEMAKNRRRR